MNIRVELFGVFRSAARTSELDLVLKEESPTVKSVISQLVSNDSVATLRKLLLDADTADPRPNALIMVSGREISTMQGLETRLSENDVVSILPVAHGG
jgi:molybdopterin converting factor small subunit